MKIINAGYQIITHLPSDEMLERLELAGRKCAKSEDRITSESKVKFVQDIINRGHESVLEHVHISVIIICDRGVSHELVRHRIASYSQESTRYCNYGKCGEVTFIKPCFWEEKSKLYDLWYEASFQSERAYLLMLRDGATPQEARTVLNNSTKTEIFVTMNIRAWRNFFKLRVIGLFGKPHPQMLEIAAPMLTEFQARYPIVFDDITAENLFKQSRLMQKVDAMSKLLRRFIAWISGNSLGLSEEEHLLVDEAKSMLNE